MKTYHSGIDTFSSDPEKDAKKDIKCLACDTLLTGVKRERYGSWASAMAKIRSWAWDYDCPNTGKPGHDHLVDLFREARDTVSDRIREMIEGELRDKRRLFLETIETERKKP